MALKTGVKELKHSLYDADEAAFFGRKRNSFDKKQTNKASRKQNKRFLDQYDDDYSEYDDYLDSE